jgi:hypothetical protein
MGVWLHQGGIMSLVVFVSRNDFGSRPWAGQLRELLQELKAEVVYSLIGLYCWLCQPRSPGDMAVLAPVDREQLAVLQGFYRERLMDEVRLAIILPTLQDELLRMAHTLHPRYLADGSVDSVEIEMVLRNLLQPSLREKNFPVRLPQSLGSKGRMHYGG